MHELSIAMSLVELAEHELQGISGRVTAVHVRIGPLAGVFNDALLASYEVASCDGPLRGSRLVIEEVPLVIFCPQCKAERKLDSLQSWRCPVCDAPASRLVHGKELELSSLEIAS